MSEFNKDENYRARQRQGAEEYLAGFRSGEIAAEEITVQTCLDMLKRAGLKPEDIGSSEEEMKKFLDQATKKMP